MPSDGHPACIVITDPSDPDENQEDDGTLPNDGSVTIYYKPDIDSAPVIKRLVVSDSGAIGSKKHAASYTADRLKFHG